MTPLEAVETCPWGPVAGAIAKELARQFGKWVTTERLFAVAYGDRADGGPRDNTLSVHVHHIRRRLAPFGFSVEGWPYAGRRMVKVGEKQ